ncbi:hypothetical protein SteCoe_24042 [Stentor coeruleus]|uniref:GOLD domain-containing protein n=1 Tax=Stentor coeruleus TaxID=5963 RepID=A0A1R2BIE3_9CILI|nr:hypothetical protein SteCoe_24042 [Stentor coeruleus]
MSENPLHHILALSLQANNFPNALKHLTSCYNTINTTSDSHLLIDFKTLTLLNRLYNKYSSQIFLPLSKLFLLISKIVIKCNTDIVLKVVNDILMLCEILKNTDIAKELEASVQELLNILSKTELENEQKEVVEGLIIKKNFETFDTKIQEIIQLVKENNITSMHELFDLFSSFESFTEQIELFSSRLSPLISVIHERNNIELAKKLLMFLEHFVFKFNYSIQINDCIELYKISKTSKLTPKILETVYEILNTIIPYDISITQHLLIIFQRLCLLFPSYINKFYEHIHSVLFSAAYSGSSDIKSKASGLLYYIINTSEINEDLKTQLSKSPELSALKNDKDFCFSLDVHEKENSVKLEDLQPFVGLPLNANIQAGEEFYYCVEIVEENSILTYGFASRYYDIDFELLRVDLPTPQIIIKENNIQCSDTTYYKSKLISSPGLYKFIWSNKKSWFAFKNIRFRIEVLTPCHKIDGNENNPHKVIDIICDDGIKITKDVLEVGIWCKEKSVWVMAAGVEEEMSELDINAIQGFIYRREQDAKRKYLSVKIGIVGKKIKKRSDLKQLKCVIMARDVDAVALLNEFEMHKSYLKQSQGFSSNSSNTLMCIMQDEGLRSCVIHKGHIMVDNNNQPIGDLSRANISDIYIGISTLLSLFGPGTVILCGSDTPNIQQVLERIKILVPEPILRNSLIKTSVYGPSASLIAASFLYFLNNKLKTHI